MAEEVVVAGRKAYRSALGIYQECGYSDTVEMLSLPTWALNKVGLSKYDWEVDNG
jgi:hypothetical protein